jgi:hypothetical protein
MSNRIVSFFLSAILLLTPLTGICQTGSPEDEVSGGIILSYRQQEAGVDAYPIRILVAPGYLRMDEGHDQDDFLLFDRINRTIFSITHENKSIIVIEQGTPGTKDVAKPDLNLGIEKSADEDVPLIAGRVPEGYRFTADGEICLEAVVVPDLLQPAVQALDEYGRLLAERQLATLANVPAEIKTPCYLSRYVYAPGRALEKGLPIQEWDSSGYLRTLMDFREDAQIDPQLFELPSGYQRQTLGR